MHYCISPEEIKTEIEKLGQTVTNIWNINQYRTKLWGRYQWCEYLSHISSLFVDLRTGCGVDIAH
jgi:hypothetical protein